MRYIYEFSSRFGLIRLSTATFFEGTELGSFKNLVKDCLPVNACLDMMNQFAYDKLPFSSRGELLTSGPKTSDRAAAMAVDRMMLAKARL